MKTVLIISGWAHGIEAIRPMGDVLADQFEVQLLTGSQVLKEQKIPDADVIVTGSMGGLLAIELLPASCKKLVLISSTAKFCAAEGYECGTHEKILKRMILMLKRNPDAVLADFYKNVHYPNPALKTDPECNLDDLVAGLDFLLESDVRASVPDIGIPVQLFHGSEDRIIPVEAAEWLHKNLPDSRLAVYEDGHGLAAHHFKPMMQELVNFVSNKD
ncbi:alpha/beta hydrolase [Pontiellaceae bacterium B1224]|nr:alpha/beta hydrolase [Pontiellaceae bacterium B1224]